MIFVFDAYGTLLDPQSPARTLITDETSARQLSDYWRAQQLEIAWTESALGVPPDFWSVTERALSVALQTLGFPAATSLRQSLLESYRTLAAFGDAQRTLRLLKERGDSTWVYSNAGSDMLEERMRVPDLGGYLDGFLSVEQAGVYKPHPEAYRYLVRELGSPAQEIEFVSSNPWDVAGARSSGMQATWVNRRGLSFPFTSVSPTRTVRDLKSLLAINA